jgi:hypothetical protein
MLAAVLLISGAVQLPRPIAAAPAQLPARTGYTLHWDFFNSPAEAERLLKFAAEHGAQILNVVPPPHIWEQPGSLATLRRVFALARERNIAVALCRIDGSAFSTQPHQRHNELYSRILTRRGRLPSGKETPEFFLTTVGNRAYEDWLVEETRYYAQNFSAEENLVGFSIGLLNEPFVSQRGSLLCFSSDTDSYELAQYTPAAKTVWSAYLTQRFGNDLRRLNRALAGRYGGFDEVPMPRNETDPAFGDPATAYRELIRAVNGWVEARIRAVHEAWHAGRKRPVPVVLQFSGYEPEKFAKGRPAFAALDIFAWMERADALGLSLYTNCEYPDWGHASDRAMANQLRLAALLGKRLFVLETGSECDGAVLDSEQLDFLAGTVRTLAPSSVIYEFLKTTYNESFATSAGKLVDSCWRPRPDAVARVRAALATAAHPSVPDPAIFVLALPDPASRPEELPLRRALMVLALERPLVFVTTRALDRLPAGSVVASIGPPDEHLRQALLRRGVRLIQARALLDGSVPASAANTP